MASSLNIDKLSPEIALACGIVQGLGTRKAFHQVLSNYPIMRNLFGSQRHNGYIRQIQALKHLRLLCRASIEAIIVVELGVRVLSRPVTPSGRIISVVHA